MTMEKAYAISYYCLIPLIDDKTSSSKIVYDCHLMFFQKTACTNPLRRDNPPSFMMMRGIAGSQVTLCGE